MFVLYLRPAVSLLLLFTLVLGVAYPWLITGVGRAAFAGQASGSPIYKDGKLVGSRLIGQSFSDPKHFWGRPSATAPQPYNGLASGGSNLGPLNPSLLEAVRANVQSLRSADPDNHAPIPVELVTASASGLDPDISPAAAEFQMSRVARARGMSIDDLRALVAKHQTGRTLGFIGEPRINVLELNLALDGRH